MDLRSLMGFVAVAEELNFRQAAVRVHLGQPGLSRLVAKLERQMGVKLLDRSTTHVELTPAGEVFLDHARAILSAMETAVRLARQSAPPPSSHLRVGVSEWTERLVPRTLQALRHVTPGITLDVGQVETGSTVEALLDESFDVVFCRSLPHHERVDTVPLIDEPLVAALPVDHPLDGGDQVDMSDLADEPLVLFPRAFAPGAHDQVVNLCDRAGFQPHIAHETVPLSPVTSLVAAGSGIALVPASAVPRFDPEHVSCHHISAPAPTMPLVLVRRRGSAPLLVRRLCELADDALAPCRAT